MKIMRLRTWLCSGLTLVFAFACAAGSVAAEWVQVEVIAFRYQQEAGSWAAAKALPDFSNATRLSPASAATDAGDPRSYQSLAAHQLRLVGAYQALARSDNLQMFFHTGWRQPDDDSRAVLLSTAVPSAEAASVVPTTSSLEEALLEGTVRVRPDGPGFFRLGASFVVQEGATPIALVESRKMLVDELHYLDHPLVGLLIQVSALTPPAATSESSP